MQQVVRHQLEMLSTPAPVLRWEGDVWSGLFMALIIQLPAVVRQEGEQASGEGREDAGQEAWRSQMTLEVAGLGRLDVSLLIARRRLEVALEAESQAMLKRLENGEAILRSRLQACGFDAVDLHLEVGDEESA